jgi:hypothetical protein
MNKMIIDMINQSPFNKQPYSIPTTTILDI